MRAVEGALREVVENSVDDPALLKFEAIRGFLRGDAACALEHFEQETYMRTEGFELLRLLLQDHLDLRATKGVHLDEVIDASRVQHRHPEPDHTRALSTVVATVRVRRLAYPRKGYENLHVTDAALNLSAERYSHGLRELAAIESTPGLVRRSGSNYRAQL